MPMKAQNDNALTVQDVAVMLNIAKNTVYELINRGELNSYNVGRKIRCTAEDVREYITKSKRLQTPHTKQVETDTPDSMLSSQSYGNGSVLCGQDLMLDILSNYVSARYLDRPVLRAYIGSYASLVALYQGNIQVASAHLWDGDTGQYNIPFVRRLLPGIPATIIHLTYRMQGFYVAKGNPKGIRNWEDLARQDITIINREKGAGSRVLLDEKLRLLGISSDQVNGYHRESQSHITVASTVARGGADIAVGTEKIAGQVAGIDFVPMQKERYELVVRTADRDTRFVRTILDVLNDSSFRAEFDGIGGYDTSEMGSIAAEL